MQLPQNYQEKENEQPTYIHKLGVIKTEMVYATYGIPGSWHLSRNFIEIHKKISSDMSLFITFVNGLIGFYSKLLECFLFNALNNLPGQGLWDSV